MKKGLRILSFAKVQPKIRFLPNYIKIFSNIFLKLIKIIVCSLNFYAIFQMYHANVVYIYYISQFLNSQDVQNCKGTNQSKTTF